MRKMKTSYTKEEIKYIKSIARDKSNKEIKELFNKKFNQNRTINSIIQIKYRNNITSYTRKYTEEQIEYLRKITPKRINKEITEMFNKRFKDNRTESSIKSIRLENNILIGRTGRFAKGNKPENIKPIGTERT